MENEESFLETAFQSEAEFPKMSQRWNRLVADKAVLKKKKKKNPSKIVLKDVKTFFVTKKEQAPTRRQVQKDL